MAETSAQLEGLVEDYLDRLRRGEYPTITEYVERHPELAERIKEVFPALALVERFKPAPGEATDDQVPCPVFTGAGLALTRLGDFRILRQIGRGGMGIVYEAEQESLGRHVALKVLPPHAVRDGTTVERFRREARVAARLHHTNIVPVFEVGQEEGVCYYAMQFIQGQGLDLVIEELRRLRDQPPDEASGPDGRGSAPPSAAEAPAPWRPSLRAEQVSQVARGMVTGRFATEVPDSDVRDPAASPWLSPVTTATIVLEAPIVPDARADGGSPEADPAAGVDAGPSPASSAVLPGGAQLSAVESGRRPYHLSVARIGEQAAQALAYAHSRGIVHRDIKPSNLLLDTAGVVWLTDFGLGLTRDEASRLTDSGNIVGTLRYLAPERFRGEADARADIYALGLTLYELLTLRPAFEAPDRFQLIEQIKSEEAHRPRAIDRRIPRDLETIILKAIDKEPARRYQSAAELADDLRRFIEDRPILARKIALPERLGRWHRRNPVVAGLLWTLLIVLSTGLIVVTGLYWNADEERRRADANFRDARTAVDDYLTTVSQRLFDVPGLEPMRKELLDSALKYYQGFIVQHAHDPSLRSDLAYAYERVGVIDGMIGARPDALAAHRHALDIRAALAREYPESYRFQQAVAQSHYNMANLLREMGRLEEAEQSHRQAIAILEPLLAGHPDVVSLRRDLAQNLNSLGVLKKTTGRMAEAEASHRRAIGLLERRTYGDDPEGTDCRRALAESYANLGSVRAMAGDTVDAGRWLQKAIPIFETLAGSHPGNTSFRQALGKTLGNLGTLQTLMGQAQEALGSFRRAVEIHEPLAREHHSVVEFQQDLAKAYTDLGSALEATDKDEAARSYQHSIEALEPMARTYPQVVSIQQDLARGLLSLVALQIDSGQWRAALPSLERALAIEEPLAREHPDDPESRRYLSIAQIGLGKVRAASGQPAEALKHWQEAVRLIESFREPMNYDLYNLSCAYALSGTVIEKVRAGAQTGRGPTAKDLLDKAMDALRRSVAAGWGDVRAMENDDLKPLRSREDYRALIAKVRSQ